MKITRQTLRADGLTVGEAMDRDAAFLRSVGVAAQDGMPTCHEQQEERRQQVRDAVLATLDGVLGGKGWTDADLPELFKALDAHVKRWEERN